MELPKVTELKKLIEFCRKTGISELKYGEFEVKLSAAAHFPEDTKAQSTEKEADPMSPLTEEEILMWSTTQIPETQEAQ